MKLSKGKIDKVLKKKKISNKRHKGYKKIKKEYTNKLNKKHMSNITLKNIKKRVYDRKNKLHNKDHLFNTVGGGKQIYFEFKKKQIMIIILIK